MVVKAICFSFDSFPGDNETNPDACTPNRGVAEPIDYSYPYIDKVAIDKFKPGDAVVIFTPDSKCPVHAQLGSSWSIVFLQDTHYAIARYAIERGLHVLVTKPATQLLSHHLELIDLSRKHNVVCFVEHHKRFAPLSLYHEVLSYAYGRLDTTQSTAMHEPVRGHLASSISSTPG
jgi:D-galacturonate reductase